MPEADSKRCWCLPLILVVGAAVALCLDFPIALTFRGWRENPTLRGYLGYFNLFEPFGHGLGLVMMLFIVHQLDPARRWALPRVALCALGAGGIANVIKLMVVRFRPHDFSFQGSILTSFGDWLPLIGPSGGQSFPSAHTALACGLATALIWLYPQGRLLFTLLAALVGVQRIVCGAHFPSDVLAGAAVGILTATLVLHVGRVPRWFASVEASWRAA